MLYIAQHAMLVRFLAAIVASAAILIALAATRTRPRHRSHGHATTAEDYRPRHGHRVPRVARYLPRHEVVAAGAVELGHHPDGALALVHADPPAEPAAEVRVDDEPTVERPALIGASA